jgi:hypothetical protein
MIAISRNHIALPTTHNVPTFEVVYVSSDFACIRHLIASDHVDDRAACMNFTAKLKNTLKLGRWKASCREPSLTMPCQCVSSNLHFVSDRSEPEQGQH